MKKGFFSSLLILLSAVICATLWLLGITYPEVFGWFSLSWAVAIICYVAGFSFVITGVFGKDKNVPLTKLKIYFGAGLLAVAIFAQISALAMPVDHIVMPIIAIVIALALLLGYMVTGGKKWDDGDNQKKGYKNYYERKAEEEKAKQDEENK